MKRILFGIALFTLAITVSTPAPAALMSESEAAARFNRAGALYREGGFREALEAYDAIIATGVNNPDLYYNAANAAFRLNMIGKSVLYLERALKLAPSDRDILANLAFVNSRKQDRDPADSDAVVAFISRWYNSITEDAAALWSGAAFALMILLATGLLFVNGWKRITLSVTATLCGVVFLASTGMLIHKVNRNAVSREAVVMTGELHAFSGPGSDNTLIFTIHEGTKVYLERNQDDWTLVRLKSGVGGWVDTKGLEKI